MTVTSLQSELMDSPSGHGAQCVFESQLLSLRLMEKCFDCLLVAGSSEGHKACLLHSSFTGEALTFRTKAFSLSFCHARLDLGSGEMLFHPDFGEMRVWIRRTAGLDGSSQEAERLMSERNARETRPREQRKTQLRSDPGPRKRKRKRKEGEAEEGEERRGERERKRERERRREGRGRRRERARGQDGRREERRGEEREREREREKEEEEGEERKKKREGRGEERRREERQTSNTSSCHIKPKTMGVFVSRCPDKGFFFSSFLRHLLQSFLSLNPSSPTPALHRLHRLHEDIWSLKKDKQLKVDKAISHITGTCGFAVQQQDVLDPSGKIKAFVGSIRSSS
ncbi:unnamed protein product [Pleuronectes platessa]|uniref:Uncharacterized protein n=1 Tax=Pleuronectes platessa TaxID=8262 RepID=A0A9N7YTJ0_PLEPL|nr:unnamed protein product [Pleuronectes platessa]